MLYLCIFFLFFSSLLGGLLWVGPRSWVTIAKTQKEKKCLELLR